MTLISYITKLMMIYFISSPGWNVHVHVLVNARAVRFLRNWYTRTRNIKFSLDVQVLRRQDIVSYKKQEGFPQIRNSVVGIPAI